MRAQLVGQSYDAQSFVGDSERSINCMVEQLPQEGASPNMLLPTPGIKSFGTAGNGTLGERGTWKMAEVLYVVYANSLYSVDNLGVAKRLGEVPGIERVIMFDNGTQLVIVADNLTHFYSNRTSTFGTINHASFLESSSGTYLEGYFLFATKNSNKIFFIGPFDDVTGEVDFDAFDATDSFLALTTPGNVVRIFSDQKELWIFKSDASEVWQPVASIVLPFAQLDGATTTRGILTKHAIDKNDNTIIWVSNDFKTYIANGYIPTPVSTTAMAFEILNYADSSDAYIHTWDEGDHKLVGVWFITEGMTWVFDFTTGKWHERASEGLASGKKYWRATSVIRCYGKTLVGDREGADIGELDFATFTEYGTEMQLIRVGQTFHAEGSQFSLDRIQVLCEAGVGLTTGQGSDPKIILALSKDYGKTYGNQKPRSLGKIGERTQRSVWRQQGLYRRCTPKIIISDPVRRYIMDMYVEMTPRSI